MDNKDIYLWGTLLALVREQLDAIDKQVNGQLGMWGKARFNSRTKTMQKFLFKLFQHKTKTHGDDAMNALLTDLETIENDAHVWNDITSGEIKYVKNILGGIG